MILRGCFAVNSYFESNGKLYCASHPQSISIQKHGPDDRFNYSWNEFSLKIRNLNETCFPLCDLPAHLAGASSPLLLPPLLLQPGHNSLLYQADHSLGYGGCVGRVWKYILIQKIFHYLQISPLLMPSDIRISPLCKCESGNIFVMENICDAKYCQ